jgi:hypothetical protein
MFVTLYGRNVGKTYLGNSYVGMGSNFVVQSQAAPASQHLRGLGGLALAFDFKQWSATLMQSFSSLGVSAEKLSKSFEEAANRLEELKVQREEMMRGPGSAPDIAGSVIGYRAFGFRSWFGPKLWPVAHSGYQWVLGVNEAKLCANNSEKEPHPYPWCSCGFWAMWDASDIPYGPMMQHQDSEWAEVTAFGDMRAHHVRTREDGYVGYIWGQIEAWGVVVEATLGFRAQYAKVKELYEIPEYPPAPAAEDYIRSLGEAYGVPVVEATFWQSWMEE